MPKKQNISVGEISAVAISGEMLRDKIYTIRGQRVMLDSDLAEIYGYTTSAFNQQVKNNIEKFDGDFMFRLNKDEMELVLISKNLISKNESRGGSRHLPYAFTEQGVYMLMTVLKGDLAVWQSKALIRTFHAMKNYIIDNQNKIEYKSSLQLAMQVMDNARDVDKMKVEMEKLDGEMEEINKKLDNVVRKSDISPIMLDFNKVVEQKEFVFLNGEPMRANELYIDIYAKARRSIYIIDDYISIRTLRQLQKVKRGVEVVIFSDNKGNYLHRSDYSDFVQEYPEMKVEFIKTGGLVHDRFIVIDYGAKIETIYHCGASAKDVGGKITAISKFEDGLVKGAMRGVVERLRRNSRLELR